MKPISEPLSPSQGFFDDPAKPAHIWQKPTLQDVFKPGVSDTFLKKKSKAMEFQKRYYTLTRDCLYYRKDETSAKIIKVMQFDNVHLSVMLKLDMPGMGFEFGFKFTKGNHFSELYTNDIGVFERWRLLLRQKCILSTFHEDFEVKKMIGKGSFAKVYLANKRSNNKECAIKAFSKEFLLSQHKGPESLRNEIIMMRRLSHRNILTLHEVHETKHSIYLVLEVLKGGELLKRIKEKRFIIEAEVIKVMHNFLEALAHIHENGIMHRDLKPENILLREEGDLSSIVIADFGLATLIDIPLAEVLFKRCGTPGFVAPEILAFKDAQEVFYDEKCDVFSAGVIFHVLLTGRKLFLGSDYKEILRANRTCSVDFSQPTYQLVNLKALDLLKKLLIVDPKHRPSARQALEHPFFHTLQDTPVELSLQPIIKVNSGTLSGMNTPIEFSKESLGSLSLVSRKPALNGCVETIEKFSQNNLNSAGNIDFTAGCLTPKKQTSKFSGAQNHGKGSEDEGSPQRKKAAFFQSDLHKKAIINNLNRKDVDEEKKN